MMHSKSKFAGKFGESPSSTNPAEVFDVRVPKYLRHKIKYARVILNGREIHLGLYGSPESKAAYERVVSEWLQSGRKTPRAKRLATVKRYQETDGDHSPLTITELAVRYFKFAGGYYLKDGKPTSEVIGIQIALRDLRKFYGDTAIDEFGPNPHISSVGFLYTHQRIFIRLMSFFTNFAVFAQNSPYPTLMGFDQSHLSYCYAGDARLNSSLVVNRLNTSRNNA
jgi:hypothetical protein